MEVQTRPGLHRRRHRCRGHRLRHHHLARRSDAAASTQLSVRRPARREVRRFRERSRRSRTTTTATARTSPASSPATATTRRGEKAGMRPERVDRRAQGARRQRPGTISHIIAALDWVVANHATYNIRVVNMSVGARITRVVLDRPADARRQGASSIAASLSSPQRATSAGTRAAAAVRRHHRAGQRAVGAHGRRVEHGGHADARRRHDGGLQLERSDRSSTSARSRIWWRRHRHRFARGAGQHVLSDQAADLVDGQPYRATPRISTLSGTSMAAPVVTGTVALMLAGQSDADAEPRQGDSPVHGAGVHPGYNPLRRAPAS